MRQEHLLLFQDRAENQQDFTKYVMCLPDSLREVNASGECTKMNAIMGEAIEETGDFIVNEKDKVVNLTEQGVAQS